MVKAIAARTPEWYAIRRTGITSTDIPPLLGLSRYKSEGDVAREKMSDETPPDDDKRLFRLGRAMEDVVADEDHIEHGIPLRRVKRFIVSKDIPWAMTSLDFERIGEKTIVEIKTSAGSEWDDGLPERVEAQVRWQMGVGRYPRAHVATLRFGRDLVCHDVIHDPVVFGQLVTIAEDFRRRLDAGGPFEESRESGRRAWPLDSGETISADPETVDAVADLLRTRASLGELSEREDRLVAAIQTRMADASTMTGPGWKVSWKRSKDATVTDWKLIAEGLLTTVDDEMRDGLMSIHTTTRTGSRRFTVRVDKENR